ncbi:uncharacterized protein YALI1_D19365g [Yarrowia lipolytica]|uniref:Nucleoporin NSP1 n=1 Tax=Yarrowia lipolytica TaxID=4952 RepID=A0A1D8NER0_YARLL|nr:hypothetical protein YALI1_D19365g [Yarrowia lipolytica]
MKQDRTKRRLYTGPYDNPGRTSRIDSMQRHQDHLGDRGTDEGQATLKSLVSSLWSKFRGNSNSNTRQRRHSVAIEEGDTTAEIQRQQQENQHRVDNNDTNGIEDVVIEEDDVEVVEVDTAAFQVSTLGCDGRFETRPCDGNGLPVLTQWVNGDAASIINAYKAAMLEKQEVGQRPERKRLALGSPERDAEEEDDDYMTGALVLHKGDQYDDRNDEHYYYNNNDATSKMLSKSTAQKKQPNRYKVAIEARRAPARISKRPKYVDSETQTSSVPISRRLPWSVDLQSLPQERMSRPGFYSANFELSDEESEDEVEAQGNVTAEEIDNLNKPLPFDLKATFLKHRTPSKRAQKTDESSSPVYTLNRAATKATTKLVEDATATESVEEQPTKALPAPESVAPAILSTSVVKPSAGFDFGGNKDRKNDAAANKLGDDTKPKPFSFGGAKDDDKSKPSFSIGAGPKDGDKPLPSFSFAGSKDGDKPKPSFSFGRATGDFDKAPKPSESKPSFSFGSSKSAEEKPNFSLGAEKTKETNETNTKPHETSFSFGAKKDASVAAPSFSFGAKPEEKKPEEKKPEEKKDAPSFSFGSKPDSENKPAAATFSFGAKSDSAPKPLTFGSKPLDKGDTNKPAAEDKAASKPMFSFGSTSNTASGSTAATTDSSNPSTITFGANAPEAPSATEKPPFSFGIKNDTKDTSTEPAAPKPLLGGFGTPSTPSALGGKRAADDGEHTSKKPMFGSSTEKLAAPFGSDGSSDNKDGSSSAPKPFSFGSGTATPVSTGSGTSAPVAFGNNSAVTTNGGSDNKPSFSFGGEAPASSKPSFSFGGAAATNDKKEESKPAAFGSAAPSFSFGGASKSSFGESKSSTAQAAKPAATGFSFGASKSTPAATPSAAPSSGFSFNKPSSEKPMFGASSTTAPSAGGLFGGDASSTGASAPSSGGLFGGASSTPSTGGLFGNSSNTSSAGMFGAKPSAESSGGFKFGSTTNAFGSSNNAASSSAATNNATPASSFGFGGAAPAQPATTGFGFGGAPSNTASSSFGATAPATNSSGGFNFGGAAPAGGAGNFSFGGIGSAGSAANTFGFNGGAAAPSTPGTPANSFGANTAPAPQTPNFGSPAPVQNNMFAQGFAPAGDGSGRKIAPLRARNRRR